MNTKILKTADGSHTLYVDEIDESYHSTHGAIQESKHIFIMTGLNSCQKKNISVLEIGFGTGFNAYLTAIEATEKKLNINYITLEKYPVDIEIIQELNYPEVIENNDLFNAIHNCNWGKSIEINEYFSIKKIACDFTITNLDSDFDLIYFDAFSPEKQPEMWTEEQFTKIYERSKPNAILCTYCAKGVVRRTLQKVGFKVERLPGPPGKREILRASKV